MMSDETRRRVVAEQLEDRLLLSTATFFPSVLYRAPQFPRATAIGDFNGDGKPDIVAISPTNDQVSVLLNRGDGTFGPPIHFGLTTGRAVAVGDFNHDGKLDIAVTRFDPNTNSTNGNTAEVDVFFGNGDGTFSNESKPERLPFFAGGRAIVAADFNHDGSTDLAVTTQNRVAVFLNNGNGTFSKPQYYSGGNDHPADVAVADFNNDGLPDLAIARGATNDVSVLLNNPAAPGTFGAPSFFPAGGNPLQLAVGDFNHDGKTDIAAVDSNFGYASVTVLQGNGNGTFLPKASYNGPPFSDAIVAGDFSGSGNLDLMVANFTNSTRLYPGNGDGTFGTPVVVHGAPQTEILTAADLNGDGKLDVIATPADGVRVLINSTSGITPTPPGGPVDQTIGAGGRRSFQFFTPDGASATVSLQGPGRATLHFTSSSTIPIPQGRGTRNVTALQLGSIAATGTTMASSLTLTARGGSRTVTFSTLTADGALGVVAAGVANVTGAISIPGGSRQVSLAGVSGGALTLGGTQPPVLRLGSAAGESIVSTAPIDQLRVSLDLAAAVTAPAIRTLSVGGSVTGSTFTLTSPFAAGAFDLKTAAVGGGIENSVIRSAGNVGAITARDLAGSTIFAGVAPLPAGQLPATSADFAAPASIASISLRTTNHIVSFANTNVAAAALGPLKLGPLLTLNNAVPFGIAAHSIRTLSATDAASGKSFVFSNLTIGANVASLLAQRDINPRDFVVRLI